MSILKITFIAINLINTSFTLNECGSGINLCDITYKLPWTKCFENSCEGSRSRYNLRWCPNVPKTECYKTCNITDKDLIIRELCAQRWVNGFLESGKCKCYQGYAGNCCSKMLGNQNIVRK